MRFAVAVWLGYLTVGAAAAADDAAQPTHGDATQVGVYKGRVELAALVGFGSSHELWGGVDSIGFLSIGARFGYVLTNPKGPGFLNGNLEVAGEVLPLFRVSQDETTYGFAMTVLGRHYFMPRSTWRPYAVLGVGFVTTKHGVPTGASPINFTPQAGFGVTYSHENRFSFYAEYRLAHMSAGTNEGGINPGVNASSLQFSATVIQW